VARPAQRLGRVVAHIPAGVHVLGWMSAAEVGVRFVSLARLADAFGVPLHTEEAESSEPAAPFVLSPAMRRRLRVIDALGARWRFSAGPCLRQALVAGHVLRRHGPHLVIGAALHEGDVIGHAWIEVGGLTFGYSPHYGPLQEGRRA